MILISTTACSDNGGNKENNTTFQDTSQHQGSYETLIGENIFKARCIKCHGISGEGVSLHAADLHFSRMDSMDIVNTIHNGKGAMPMFDGSIPDSVMGQLVMYVKNLRK